MSAIALAYIGVALMVGVNGIASSIGTARPAMASVGALRKNRSAFGSYLVLSAFCGSQGLYGFVSYFMVSKFLVETITMFQGIAILLSGVVVASVGFIGCWLQSKVCASGIVEISNGNNIMSNTLILAAIPELYAILSVAMVYLVSTSL